MALSVERRGWARKKKLTKRNETKNEREKNNTKKKGYHETERNMNVAAYLISHCVAPPDSVSNKDDEEKNVNATTLSLPLPLSLSLSLSRRPRGGGKKTLDIPTLSRLFIILIII